MHKFIVASILALAVAIPSGVSAHDPDKKPDGEAKKARELAADCSLAMLGAGAYATLTAEQVAAYCVTLATEIFNAEYP